MQSSRPADPTLRATNPRAALLLALTVVTGLVLGGCASQDRAPNAAASDAASSATDGSASPSATAEPSATGEPSATAEPSAAAPAPVTAALDSELTVEAADAVARVHVGMPKFRDGRGGPNEVLVWVSVEVESGLFDAGRWQLVTGDGQTMGVMLSGMAPPLGEVADRKQGSIAFTTPLLFEPGTSIAAIEYVGGRGDHALARWQASSPISVATLPNVLDSPR